MDDLQGAIKQAMIAKDEHRLATLRMLKSAADLASKEKGSDLEAQEFLSVVRKQIKMRHDACEGFKAAGSDEKAAREQTEATYLQEFMPEQMSEPDLSKLIDEVAAREGLVFEKKSMGRLIGLVAEEVGDKASKSDIARVINGKIEA